MAEIIGVSALNKYVRSVLEGDAALAEIAIRGEISNFSRNHKTGHCYFSLKDAKASVKVVMFRSYAEALAFAPADGMTVVARGKITLYERDGAFQINAEYLFADGIGAAKTAFDQLKERLNKEGLFAPEAKKPLPAFPKLVGLVTSQTGAALQDILRVAQHQCPVARFLLAPVTVQGTGAPADIIAALRRLDAAGADVIIVARGGGSAEDLWVFNDEGVARAVYACRAPVVAGVGHEIDFTIIDFVADVRAPTPSAAAQQVLPDVAALQGEMLHIMRNIASNIQFMADSWYNHLVRLARHSAWQAPTAKAAARKRALAMAQRGIKAAAHTRLVASRQRIQAAAALAAGLSPYAVLARGYSVVKQNGNTVRGVAQVNAGQPVDVVMQDGQLACRIETITHRERAGEAIGEG